MKTFSCAQCEQLLFFENVECTRCGSKLAYLPDRRVMTPVQATQDGTWDTALEDGASGTRYRLCENYLTYNACNWAVRVDDAVSACIACRLNQTIPNLADSGEDLAWRRLEQAKRRLVFTLLDLGLPVRSKQEDADGMAFAFLSDTPSEPVVTGHEDGVITINTAEADDVRRENTRRRLGEAYRTLLGHFRHEVGHYYWDRLVRSDAARHGAFGKLFGDESVDYGAAVQQHYENGPRPHWQQEFVSAYASMHPWEDFAESWAHYLHMVDTLQTAESYGLYLRPDGPGPLVRGAEAPMRLDLGDFDDVIGRWLPLTVVLNGLNRSMGAPDPYPFVLPTRALEKLRFVHDTIATARRASPWGSSNKEN